MKKYSEIKKVEYNPKSKDPFAFKHYNPDELVMGKPMREHLKFAMSYWHTIDAEGVDMFGSGTIDKSFGLAADPLAMYRKKADFAFELMDKLQLDYYCFHDVDIAPEGKTVAESIAYFNEMVDYIAVLQKKHGKKLLWNTANNFGDKKFMAGAATSPNADVYAVAAAKVKAGIDAQSNSARTAMCSGAAGKATTPCSTRTWRSSSTTSAGSCRCRATTPVQRASRARSISNPSPKNPPSTSMTSMPQPA